MFRPDGFPHFPPASRNPPPYARFFTNDCLNPSGGLRHGLPSTHTTQSQAAVARATAGKVLASRCARQGQSTCRGMITPPMKCIISTTWYLYRAAGSSSSSNCVRGYQPRPSRPGSP